MNKTPLIIGFAGLAQSGKTTAANIFVTHGWLRMSFAAPLKAMLAVLTSETDKNATPPELCGKSVREALQTLGTDWGRGMIGPGLWVNVMRQKLTDMLERVYDETIEGIVIDDVRFPEEVCLISELGGVVGWVHRESVPVLNHISEQALQRVEMDFTVDNNGTITELHQQLAGVFPLLPAPPRLDLPSVTV